MQTPFLWSGISILLWKTGTGYRQFLQILLQRSQAHPLNITMIKCGLDNLNRCVHLTMVTFNVALKTLSVPNVDHCLQDQMDMFTPHASQWQTFKYDCDESDDVSLVTALLANLSVPILESFNLHLSLPAHSEDGGAFKILEGGAPKLWNVSICGIHPFTCLPPLSSVTTLHIGAGPDKMSGNEFLYILQSFVTLTSLDLDGSVVSPYDLHLLGMQGENVKIARLRLLSFAAEALPRYCIDGILDIIRCPAIKSINISRLNS